MKFRVEIEETITTTRETWIEAESETEAEGIAESQDWRTYSEVDRSVSTHINLIEPAGLV